MFRLFNIFQTFLYVFGLFGALGVKTVAKKKGTPVAHMIGSLLVLLACVWVGLIVNGIIDNSSEDTWKYFVIFALFGAGLNMLVCSAYGLIAEFIGSNVKYSAFVYGIFGLGDKVLNGVIMQILENFNPCNQDSEASAIKNQTKLVTPELNHLNETIISQEESSECKMTECDYYGHYISRGISLIVIAGLALLALFKFFYGKKLHKSSIPQSEKSSLAEKKEKVRLSNDS